MMETPRAASPINLDAAAQAKPGVKADKIDGDGKKSGFKQALEQQASSKGKGTDLAALTDGEALVDSADTLGQTAAAEVMAPRPKKPIVLLTSQFSKVSNDQVSEPDADPLKAAPAKDRVQIRQLAKALSAADAADKSDAEAQDAAAAGGAGQLAVSSLVGAKHLHAAKSGAGSKSGMPADDAEAKSRGEDVADVTAKDALGMLQDRTSALVPNTHASGKAMTSDAKADGVVDHAEATSGNGASHSYRLSRADGKGGVLDIPGPDMPTDEKLQQTASNTSSVTVLDQRRFLAPAQDNALSVINSISSNGEWTSALQPESALANAASIAGGGKVVNTLKIQMHPIDLGLVTATLRLSGEELTVDLRVETGAAYRQLKEDQSRIVDALKSQGFNVDQVTVVMAPERADTSSGANGNQSGGQGAAFAQQQSRDGGQGAPTGRDRRAYEQERTGNGSISVDDSRVETGALRGPGGTRSGDVYL